jgi:hypothetical protein
MMIMMKRNTGNGKMAVLKQIWFVYQFLLLLLYNLSLDHIFVILIHLITEL